MNRINYKYFLIGLFMFFTGCSTEKNTLINRSYHNLTANYNIYFNGGESFKKGIKKQETSYTDNYAKILELFKYSNEEIANSIAPDMETAIKKATKLISMHSITSKPKRKKANLSDRQKKFYNKKEFNRWVDDAYLLIGKASFYKHDFAVSAETFRYVITNFPNQKEKYIAQMYLLRIFIETGEFKSAGELFDKLNSDRKFPKKFLGEYNAIYSDYYLKQKRHEQVIPKLQMAIEKTRNKKLKIRYTYILAQLYQELKNNDKAIDTYEKVIKMNPSYEMAFNAKINRATLLDSGSESSKEIKKELKKMLKDDKNKEYKDQIYYALGRISLRENKKEEAIEYFKKSAGSSIYNNTQKVMSYLQLAELYFQMPKYMLSKAYYDSTMVSITSDYPNYDEILLNTKILNELVGYLNTIEYQDSLQRVASLSEDERNKLIDELIEKAAEEEKRKQEMLEQERLDKMYNPNAQNTFKDNISGGGKWYFYNPSAMSFGQNEFVRIWGRRKLEDNWRRKNKQIVASFTDAEKEDSVKTETISEKEKFKKTDRNYYLADIPLTPEKIETSNKQIAFALFAAGKLYREKLEDIELAKKSFEKLIERYPDDENAIQAYYYLYLIAKEKNDLVSKDYYKNIILRKYPNSNYVQIITNPNYIKEIEERNKKIEDFYNETYTFYINGEYSKVNTNYQFATENYSDSYLIPKFSFLNSLTAGENNNWRKLKTALQEVVNKYPDDEVTVTAKDILAKIDEREFTGGDGAAGLTDVTEIEKEKSKDEVQQLYHYNDSTPHCVVLVAKTSLDLNQLKFNITAFIVDYYDYDKQIITDEPFSNLFRAITIKGFDNAAHSMEFYRKIALDDKAFNGINTSDYQLFAISKDNLVTFMKDKSVKDYLLFFTEFYLK